MRTVPRESDIQRAIMDYLAAERIPAIRYNTGVFMACDRLVRAHSAGSGHPDIIAWPEKRVSGLRVMPLGCGLSRSTLFIEVKSPGGKQSSAQKGFELWAGSNDLSYLLADSLDVVKQWVEEHR